METVKQASCILSRMNRTPVLFFFGLALNWVLVLGLAVYNAWMSTNVPGPHAKHPLDTVVTVLTWLELALIGVFALMAIVGYVKCRLSLFKAWLWFQRIFVIYTVIPPTCVSATAYVTGASLTELFTIVGFGLLLFCLPLGILWLGYRLLKQRDWKTLTQPGDGSTRATEEGALLGQVPLGDSNSPSHSP